MALRSALALSAVVWASADYFKYTPFSSNDCTGEPSYIYNIEFPTGCVTVGPITSEGLKCVNSSYGDLSAHYLSSKCAGTGTRFGNRTGGCLPNGSGVGSSLAECVSSTRPFELPKSDVAISMFASQ